MRCAQRVSRFPVTPALSLGQKANPPLPFSTTQRGVCPTNLPSKPTCRRLFPLPVGKGRGEGNRITLFNKGSRRREEADFGAKDNSASLPRRLRSLRRVLNSPVPALPVRLFD